jgi:hypothetical protein
MPPRLTDLWQPRVSDFEQWLVVAVAALLGAAALFAAGTDVAVLRGLVFVGGPLLWMAGLAPRLAGYLHDDARARLLPLPLPAEVHWRAAAPRHRRGLGLGALVGAAAIALGTVAHVPGTIVLGLVGDWLWLGLVVALSEAWSPAVAAWLGRRFARDSLAQRLQTSLSGGWTLPEASVHLYAPPLLLGLATALAIPGQLWLDFTVDGRAVPAGLTVAALTGPAFLALLTAPWPRRLYARGVFDAVPWLAQATRTLAGPAVPSPLPRFVQALRRPDLRLFAIQLWRTTPVPGLRLWTLCLVAAWVGLLAGPTLPRVTIVAACALAWVVPAVRVWTELAAGRATALAGDPHLHPQPRAGLGLVLAPVAFAAVMVGLGYTGA